MVAAHVRRGLVAGLLAGLAAAVFALAVGQPHVDAAIALEVAAAGDHHDDHQHEATFSRPVQKAGMVGGFAVTGLAVGALFGVAAAWSVGRVRGDAWSRSLKLGVVVVAALVLLPALYYPPNPPAVGAGDTVGIRSAAYLGLIVFGLLLAAAAWSGARELARTGLPAPLRQLVVAAGVAVGVVAVALVLPPAEGAGRFPADLLWSFRLSSVGSQVVLHGLTAMAFGLLGLRAERRREQRADVPA